MYFQYLLTAILGASVVAGIPTQNEGQAKEPSIPLDALREVLGTQLTDRLVRDGELLLTLTPKDVANVVAGLVPSHSSSKRQQPVAGPVGNAVGCAVGCVPV